MFENGYSTNQWEMNEKSNKIYLVDYLGIEYENVWRTKKGLSYHFLTYWLSQKRFFGTVKSAS